MREREEKLGRLVNSAMDAIIELDRNLNVTRVNAAAEKIFGCSSQQIVGQLFTRFLSSDSRETTRYSDYRHSTCGRRESAMPGYLAV